MVLFLSVILSSFLFYSYPLSRSLPSSFWWKLLGASGGILLFWAINIRMRLFGEKKEFSFYGWFSLFLLLLQGPVFSFLATLCGLSLYCLSTKETWEKFFFFRRLQNIELNTLVVLPSLLLVSRVFLPPSPLSVLFGAVVFCLVQVGFLSLLQALNMHFGKGRALSSAFQEAFNLKLAYLVWVSLLILPALTLSAWLFVQVGRAWVVLLFAAPFLLFRAIAFQEDQKENEDVESTSTVAKILDARDKTTGEHSIRVSLYAKWTALYSGYPMWFSEWARMIGLLHDFGKVVLWDRILFKPASLSPDEKKHVNQHTMLDGIFLTKIPWISTLRKVFNVGRLHHQWYRDPQDPLKSYPYSWLEGKDLPVIARILMVADSWDTMTSIRPYKEAVPDEKALAEIRKWTGTQFDPQVVEGFLRAYEAGAITAIQKGREPEEPKEIQPILLQESAVARRIKAGFSPEALQPSSATEKKSGGLGQAVALGKAFLQEGVAFFKNSANAQNGFLFLWLALAVCLFFLPSKFSLIHNPEVLLASLVVWFAFWRLSILQWPRMVPELAAFIPLLFLGTPLSILLELLALAVLIRTVYVPATEKSYLGESLYFIQWGLLLVFSYEFFVRSGLQNNMTVFQPQPWLMWLSSLVHFFEFLLLWVLFFTLLHFLFVHLETLFRRKKIWVPADWQDLRFSCLANLFFAVFGLLLFAASGLTPGWFSYEVTIFSLILFVGQKMLRNYGLRREASYLTMEILSELPRGKYFSLVELEERKES